ncbi:AraC family transcriptional regulator [Dyadobacter frigoris]|uniref:Helix-turn-helix domain-containing protein n=1 Tax=Dyadobacter frigoris TaxID=2576211 RepID=A0A4U6D2P1_9BACT|nr:AraC family transcriptional regulator [Dyadobacter frigoris]TKT90585.1 helix-turn-helix domain-containing protein [Dyadobacter frigoris]GLU51270.1 AraC family transcriptional regulator [Dyadobacter frigoris]
MKATFALLPDFAQARKPFLVKKIVRPYFSTDFHFHTECQLVHILSGSGTRIIGDSIEHFEEGDLAFVGPNVPHVWYSQSQSAHESMSVALYINPEAVSEKLEGLIDTKELRRFFKESERGISVCGVKKALITDILMQMPEQKNIELLASFIQILHYLLDPEELVWLNVPNLLSVYNVQAPGRVHKLMHFIQQNFKQEITLQQAASVSGLQIHSFCRFFKSLTNRTFSDFLNEVRIGFASKLLLQSDLPVTQIALECGYTNISYFNRCFKKINKVSPKDYRNSNQIKN